MYIGKFEASEGESFRGKIQRSELAFVRYIYIEPRRTHQADELENKR